MIADIFAIPSNPHNFLKRNRGNEMNIQNEL